MGEGKGVYRVLVGQPKGKRLLERPRCKWEDNTNLNVREIGINEVKWMHARVCVHSLSLSLSHTHTHAHTQSFLIQDFIATSLVGYWYIFLGVLSYKNLCQKFCFHTHKPHIKALTNALIFLC
jgi:hypothetical protein